MAALALYLVTLHRGLPPLDSAEFVTAALARKVPHAPGYPLITLLGILASKVPLGEPAARINAVSAVSGAAAVALCYLAGRQLGCARVGSAIGAATLATAHVFWRFAVVSEVLALHTVVVLGLFLAAIRFHRTGDERIVPLAAALFGLGICHLHTIVLAAPSVAILLSERRISSSTWARSALAFALPLLLYAWLPLASPELREPRQFLDHLLRREYGTFSLTPLAHGDRLANAAHGFATFARRLAADLRWIGLAPVFLGAWALWRSDRRAAAALFLYLALSVPLFLLLANAPDQPLFTHVLEKQWGGALAAVCLLLAAGLSQVGRVAPAAPVAFAALPLWMAVANFAACDQRGDRRTEEYSRLVLGTVEDDALVLSCYDTLIFALRYRQLVLGEKPAVSLVHYQRGTPLPAGRPIYTTFAGTCNERDLLGPLREHLIPQGVVYRVGSTRTRADVEHGAILGLRQLAEHPEVFAPAGDQSDLGAREVVGWAADAVQNLGVALDAIGRSDEARGLRARAASLRW
jgi:hypothetical protein